jgi:hypothetical protein
VSPERRAFGPAATALGTALKAPFWCALAAEIAWLALSASAEGALSCVLGAKGRALAHLLVLGALAFSSDVLASSWRGAPTPQTTPSAFGRSGDALRAGALRFAVFRHLRLLRLVLLALTGPQAGRLSWLLGKQLRRRPRALHLGLIHPSVWEGCWPKFATAGNAQVTVKIRLRLLAGPDGYDPHVPPVPWREPEPPEARDLRIAWSPRFPGG